MGRVIFFHFYLSVSKIGDLLWDLLQVDFAMSPVAC